MQTLFNQKEPLNFFTVADGGLYYIDTKKRLISKLDSLQKLKNAYKLGMFNLTTLEDARAEGKEHLYINELLKLDAPLYPFNESTTNYKAISNTFFNALYCLKANVTVCDKVDFKSGLSTLPTEYYTVHNPYISFMVSKHDAVEFLAIACKCLISVITVQDFLSYLKDKFNADIEKYKGSLRKFNKEFLEPIIEFLNTHLNIFNDYYIQIDSKSFKLHNYTCQYPIVHLKRDRGLQVKTSSVLSKLDKIGSINDKYTLINKYFKELGIKLTFNHFKLNYLIKLRLVNYINDFCNNEKIKNIEIDTNFLFNVHNTLSEQIDAN